MSDGRRLVEAASAVFEADDLDRLGDAVACEIDVRGTTPARSAPTGVRRS